MSNPALPQKKIFSYGEAAALLPEVRSVTEEAYKRIELLRGELLKSIGSAAELEERMNEVVTRWFHAMVERGLEVKGLWLVDFDNGSGYYCWRYPEAALEYFHTYDDGFGGRMRIQ